MNHLKLTILSVVFLGILIGNVFFWNNLLVGIATGLFWLIFFGTLAGKRVAKQEHPWLTFGTGSWILLSLIMIAGSIAYYSATLTTSILLVIALLSVPISWWMGTVKKTAWWHRTPHDKWTGPSHTISPLVWLVASVVIVLLVGLVALILQHQITEPVRSLWDHLPNSVFVVMGVMFLFISVRLFRGSERSLSLPLVMALLFVCIATAALAFPIGYGFDTFLHEATESHIAQFGTISPKPFYYIGQYALILFFHKVFFLPIPFLNTFLVPLLTALLLPVMLYRTGAHLWRRQEVAMGSVLFLFLLPLSSFILTTPQALANLWLLLLLVSTITVVIKKTKGYWLVIPALAILLTHPLAGIPAVIFVLLFLLVKSPHPLARPGFFGLASIGAVALPASFLLNAARLGTSSPIDWAALHPARLLQIVDLSLFFENRFNPLLDFVYVFGQNRWALILVFASFGYLFLREYPLVRRLYVTFGIMLFFNFVLLSTIVDFSFLIDYERSDYANRIGLLLLFTLAPFALTGFGQLLVRLKQHTTPTVIRLLFIALFSAFALSNWYLSYPTNDAYGRSAGFNVGQSDINTVYAIDAYAKNKPYLVLANQAVSAAAVRTFGFVHYYDETFYYPIPTGGPLYQQFLDMNARPDTDVIERVHTLADVDLVFYVVNDYWWNAPVLVETSKSIARDWFSVDGGATHVFVF